MAAAASQSRPVTRPHPSRVIEAKTNSSSSANTGWTSASAP